MMDIIAHITKFNSMSNGRDKLCRLCQYASKYAGWRATLNDKKELIQKFKSLENSLSASRKVLRLGKSLDMIQGAVRSTSVAHPLVRLCLIVSKLNTAVYLLVDHYVWATKIGLTSADAKELSRVASRFWLMALICNLVRNIHDIRNIIHSVRLDARGRDEAMNSREGQRQNKSALAALLSDGPVVVDTVKNAADLLLPLTNLGYLDTPVQVQALLGITSSIMGILAVWEPRLKLKP